MIQDYNGLIYEAIPDWDRREEELKDLMEQKRKIVEKHMDRLERNFRKTLEIKERAVSDRALKGGLNLSVLNKVTASLNFDQNKLIGMDGGQRMEYAKQWSEDARSIVDILRNDKGYESLLGDIDRQLKSAEEELKQINQELLKCEDDDRKELLKQERNIRSQA